MKRKATLLPPLLFLLLLSTLSIPEVLAQSEFPHQFTLDSRSADTLQTPSSTSVRHRYRVTAWGTYSMWEDTLNSSVDPMWIYSFPDEEWEKPEWRIFTEGYPIWVGDPRLFDSHGLRVNGSAMPEMPLDDDHRYSMIIQGTGEPISVAIVDWNFRGLQKRDAHENNSGYLYVLVEELPLYEADLCAVDSSGFPSVRVSVNVTRDSVRLENIADVLSLYENGLPVSIDSIDCDERLRPVSVGLVLDRSGSMSEPWGTTTRLAKVQEAARGFVNRLGTADEAALYTFGTDVTNDQTWTSEKRLLLDAIDRVRAGGYTAMNDAVDMGVRASANRPPSFRRAVLLLSDGEDNISKIRDVTTVAERAAREGIPVFTIGLLYETVDSLRYLAEATGGRHFSVSDPGSIDSVFGSIAEILFEKGCCNVWYTSPQPEKNGTWRDVDVVFRFESDTIEVGEGGYRAPSGASGVSWQEAIPPVQVMSRGDHVVVEVGSISGGLLKLRLIDVSGRTHIGPIPVEVRGGPIALPVDELPSGVYFVQVSSESVAVLSPVYLVR